MNQVSQTTGSRFRLLDDLSHYGFQYAGRKAREMHKDVGDGTIIWNRSQEAPPQLPTRLQHPWFKVQAIGEADDTFVSFLGKLVESVKTNQFGGTFDEFLRKELPISSARNDNEPAISPD